MKIKLLVYEPPISIYDGYFRKTNLREFINVIQMCNKVVVYKEDRRIIKNYYSKHSGILLAKEIIEFVVEGV